ncbi:MAG: pilin [Patescibacteria group bacterium]|nr:pilin [Patescibacteria group bacterium]
MFIFVVVVTLTVPFVASAQQVSFPYWPSDNNPILPCTGLDCVDLCQLLSLFQHLIYFGMTVAVMVIAPLFLIWGGFMILISGGSTERISKGKTILTSTIIGIAMALGAFLIVNTFLWVLGNNPAIDGPNKPGGVNWPNVACTVQAPPPVAPPPAENLQVASSSPSFDIPAPLPEGSQTNNPSLFNPGSSNPAGGYISTDEPPAQ